MIYSRTERESIAMARNELSERLSWRKQPSPIVQLHVIRQHARAVVAALRADGRDVLTTDADVERWVSDVPSSPETEYYPIVTVRARLMRHSNGNEWWE